MNDFTGDFSMPTRERRDVTVRDEQMPTNVRAQPGMGDLEEQFQSVTRDFDVMHQRIGGEVVADPMLEFDPEQDFDDIQQDASMAASGVLDTDVGEFDVDDINEFRREF